MIMSSARVYCLAQLKPMTIAAGTRLGPYEIVAPIGAGGMGEVWRGRDTRLERSVAIKVLPSHLSSDPQLRERFDREARAISGLTHPHICTLYDVGHQDGIDYLVMEYLEGETLADRLSKGPLPLDQVIRYGLEIAEALKRAHRAGVVHRDLKPGNIMLTKEGAKLLDFGLAKTASLIGASSPQAATVLPTEQKPLTAEGTIIGTLQYMAPEQLEGLEADARTDIFAFGALLYEMATGRRAFEGKSRTSLIAAIIDRDPAPISSVQPLAPAAFERVVRTCLAKDPDERFQSVHDVWLERGWLNSAPLAESGHKRKALRALPWVVAVAIALGLGLAYRLTRRPTDQRITHAAILAPENSAFDTAGLTGPMALSPDGKWLAFVALADGKERLWVRSMDSTTVKSLEGTEGAAAPFWSPDGAAVAFFANGKLLRADLAGGAPEEIARFAGLPVGGSWSATGGILFTSSFVGGEGIMRIAPGGAATEALHSRSGEQYSWPVWLNDGRRFLYSVRHDPPTAEDGIFISSIEGGAAKRVVSTVANAIYVSSGLLLYRRGSALVARRFNERKGELIGPEVRLVDAVGYMPVTSCLLATANDRQLVYARSSLADAELVWYDRSGKLLEKVGAAARYYSPKLSHDGSRIAVDISDEIYDNGDIWVFDLPRHVSSRVTFSTANESAPVWSADDRHLVFMRSSGTGDDLIQTSPFGTGGEETLIPKNGKRILATDWSSDGRWMLIHAEPIKGGVPEAWVLDRTTGRFTPRIKTSFSELDAHFSPDGQWIAYTSNESGRFEVYVQPFEPTGAKWLVSRGGGNHAAWRGDSRELFYVTLDGRMMSVPITTTHGFDAGVPAELFAARMRDFPPRRQYDATPDGQRFLLVRMVDENSSSLDLVLNWESRLPE